MNLNGQVHQKAWHGSDRPSPPMFLDSDDEVGGEAAIMVSLSERPAGVSEVKCVNTRPPPRTETNKRKLQKISQTVLESITVCFVSSTITIHFNWMQMCTNCNVNNKKRKKSQQCQRTNLFPPTSCVTIPKLAKKLLSYNSTYIHLQLN